MIPDRSSEVEVHPSQSDAQDKVWKNGSVAKRKARRCRNMVSRLLDAPNPLFFCGHA